MFSLFHQSQKNKGKTDCEPHLEAYLRCVDKTRASAGGLRDGSDCTPEADLYKACRTGKAPAPSDEAKKE